MLEKRTVVLALGISVAGIVLIALAQAQDQIFTETICGLQEI
jgi:hypothetical protein